MAPSRNVMMMDFLRSEAERRRKCGRRRDLVRRIAEWLHIRVGVDARRIVGVVEPVDINGGKA